MNSQHTKLYKKLLFRIASSVINYRQTKGAVTNNKLAVTCTGLTEPYGPVICTNFEPVLKCKDTRLFGTEIEVKTLYNCPSKAIISDPLLKKIALTLALQADLK